MREQVRVRHGLVPTNLAEFGGLIEEKVAYFDRAKIWFRRDRPPGNEDIVNALCGGGAQQITTPMQYKQNGTWVENPMWLSQWDLCQPSDEVFAYLREQTTCPYLINNLEIALDLITVDIIAAERLQDFFVGHLTKSWPGKQRARWYGRTYYIGGRRKGAHKKIKVYCDRRSKVSGDSCCHVEWTLQGSNLIQTTKHVGISTFEDLLTFDHHAFWKANLTLRDIINFEKVGKACLGRQRKRKPQFRPCGAGLLPINLDERAGLRFLQAHAWLFDERCTDERDASPASFSIQALLENGKPFKNCVRKIPNDQFLPSPRRRVIQRPV